MVESPRRSGSVDRREYILSLVSIPGVKGAGLVKAAEKRLAELYPGDPSACRWDYRRLRSPGREELLVAMVNPSRVGRSGLYIPLFHAVDLKLHRRPAGVSLYEANVSDTLKPSPEGGYTLTHRRERGEVEAVKLPAQNRNYRGAFRERSEGALLLRISPFLLIAAGLLLGWGTIEMRERRAELAELIALRREYTALIEELQALEEGSAPPPGEADRTLHLPPPFPLLALIAEQCPEKSRLKSFDYSLERSIGEFESPDALVLYERMGKLSKLRVTLSGEVRSPGPGAEREEYHLLLEPQG